MTERPILFSGPMVSQILAGRKTQTRRMLKPQIPGDTIEAFYWWHGDYPPESCARPGVYFRTPSGLNSNPCPFGVPGDHLWVRETHRQLSGPDWGEHQRGAPIEYRADGEYPSAIRWRPSIHMPRWASRLTLEITAVRVERLQSISEADAEAEGCERIELGPWEIHGQRVHPMTSTYCEAFAKLWDSLYAKRPGCDWASNCWVWVVEFKVVRAEWKGK